MNLLSKSRDHIAEKMQIPKSVILSKEQMKQIVINVSNGSLSNWQKKLLSKTSAK